MTLVCPTCGRTEEPLLPVKWIMCAHGGDGRRITKMKEVR